MRTAAFQFQYGSIKSFSDEYQITFQGLFQFQYGSIKSLAIVDPPYGIDSFNSNMVQLRELLPSLSNFLSECFNSNMVQLRV